LAGFHDWVTQRDKVAALLGDSGAGVADIATPGEMTTRARSVGTFNTSALWGLSGNNHLGDIARATKRTAEAVEKIEQKPSVYGPPLA